MTDVQIIRDSAALISDLAPREQKWIRSFNRYANNNRRTENIWNPRGIPLSYVFTTYDQDLGVTPIINVCKSAVDTHISKLMAIKVRPFFNTVNGGFKTRKIVRATQQYYDQLFVEQSIYHEAIEAARDADIFEVGYLWADDETGLIRRVRPWEVYFDRAEYQVGKLTRLMLRFREYPLNLLKGKVKKNDPLLTSLEDGNKKAGVEYCIYYDLEGQMRYELIAGRVVGKRRINFSIAPIAEIYYQTPIKGSYSTSLIDDIYSIQTEIDQTTDTIHQAMSLTPANMVFIPEGSDIKKSMVTNAIGSIYEYNAAGGIQDPIHVVTPAPISPMYIENLKFWIETAYNITGISQLSAQSKKPTGLSSGVALQTLEDVESDRNELQLQNYMKLLMDITKVHIQVMDDSMTILPPMEGRANVTFGELKKESARMSIQYSPASALSKDPQTKLQQIEKMLAMKMIPEDMAASLMEIPDLERIYSVETANLDVCERIIERAVENSDITFYETLNIDQLINLTAYYINRYDANDEGDEIMGRLVALLNSARAKKDEIVAAVTPPPAPPAPPAPQPVTNEIPAQGVGPVAEGLPMQVQPGMPQ